MRQTLRHIVRSLEDHAGLTAAVSFGVCLSIAALWWRGYLLIERYGTLGWQHFETHHYLLFRVTEFQSYSGPVVRFEVVSWFVGVCVLLAAVLPARWVLRERRRKVRAARAIAGCCTVCGYDLRGSPARCPECGAASTDGRAAVA